MKVYILSGISGSGKSNKARGICYTHRYDNPSPVICSADDFFTANGNYHFNPSLLSKAHNACMRQFLNALYAETPIIIVDNTNTTVVEIAPYYSAAAAFGAEIEIITIISDPTQAFKRNRHNVPLDTILAQDERISDRSLPHHWVYRAERILNLL